MTRHALAATIMADLDEAAAIRHRFAGGEAAAARQSLREWQAARLARTHADLLASPRYGKAAVFFLTDLYGPDATATRYEEAQRAMPITLRMLPEAGLATLADAWHLDALSESLDAAMIEALGNQIHRIDNEAYARAYAAVARPDDRARQIDLIGVLAHTLERFGQKRYARTALHLMRDPARLAGFGDLQGFLERGLEALHCMGRVAPFIETVSTRETAIMRDLLAGNPEPLSWSPPG
jgi:hypothetical protein